jgi:hypothetical protein
MIPVKCPRCTLVWYSNEKDGGRVRLCSDCTDALKRNRRWEPVRIDAFVIAAGVFVLVDLLFIPLAALMPGTFGEPLRVYGLVLSISALSVFSVILRISWWGVRWGSEADTLWPLMRWPVMIGPAGLACVMAYYSLGIPAWQEKQALARAAALPPGVDRLHPEPTFRAPPPRVPPAATDLPGVLGYWSFDDNSPASKVADQSGKGNTATARGATRTEGIRGKALAFNGSDAYLDYGTSPDFNFAANASFTLACWVKTRKTIAVVCGQQSSTDEKVAILLTVDRGLPCGIVRPDGAAAPVRVLGRQPVPDDNWHHLALTRDGDGTIELFLDGASQGQATGQGANGPITTDVRILGADPRWARLGMGTSGLGTSGGGLATYLLGSIDEFCILGRKLTDREIRTLAGR